MNTEDNVEDGSLHERPLDDRTRWALRDLRRDIAPGRDLWPRIAARMATNTSTVDAGHTTRSRPRRFAPLALVASLLLAVGVAWHWQPPRSPSQPMAKLMQAEAHAMTREYNAALREVEASAPQSAVTQQPALRELDRSAAQIRTALARDPDARFLLERLRHTYSLRLALTQRAALS
ncbi:MAG: hypothetical protein ACMG5Z_00850 [Luteimonas sp.]